MRRESERFRSPESESFGRSLKIASGGVRLSQIPGKSEKADGETREFVETPGIRWRESRENE
jgi:hypothetical protein